MLFDTVLLHSFIKLKGERSTNATYYILTGRKSIQTIQDIHLFELKSIYGIYKNLSKPCYVERIKKMVKRGLLERNESNSIVTTEDGYKWYINNYSTKQLSHFRGSIWCETSKPFMLRLQLLIQVLTNSHVGNKNYVPVVENDQVENWVKRYYQYIKKNSSVTNVLSNLYKELHRLLRTFSEEEATMFVARLSGYNHYGMSLEQLAHKYRTSVSNINLILERTIHRMLSTISNDKHIYSTLFFVINDFLEQNRLTHSARITYKWLKKQYTPESIATIRKLSLNTIQDHIVEITLYDHRFPIDTYVDSNKQIEIVQAIKETSTSKLKTIKAYVSDDITYFQIRLVLARLSQIKEEISYETSSESKRAFTKTF